MLIHPKKNLDTINQHNHQKDPKGLNKKSKKVWINIDKRMHMAHLNDVEGRYLMIPGGMDSYGSLDSPQSSLVPCDPLGFWGPYESL